MPSRATGLFQPQPRETVVADLVARSRARLAQMDETRLVDLLEDAVYNERKRLEKAEVEPAERDRIDRLARAVVRGTANSRLEAALDLVAAWADEIHGRFSPRAYKLATRAMPRALTALLSGKPERLRDWDLSWDRRLEVDGDLPLLRTLADEATLILAPTHVSNLDSPLIGLALYKAGLPPFVYGAGLNLFSNPIMGWWLRRLGAYTVDRRKKCALYKDVLKDYSTRCLVTRHHSLFFPGGTRSRSGAIESRVKKGLLGTGVVAWQEMLAANRRDPEVYVVPLTLSFQLTLEASSLIRDHLAEAGGSRFIIADDEFDQPREVASFARRMMNLDSAIVTRFGDPVDLLGNPVPKDREERLEVAGRRHRYVTGTSGEVEWDEQRDRVYTDRLAEALVRAYPRGATVMSTHLAAWVGWTFLEDHAGTRDEFRVVRVDHLGRHIPRQQFLGRLVKAMGQVEAGAANGSWHADLPESAEELLEVAIDRFGRYHKTRALALHGGDLVVEDPQLCLYYRNRAAFTKLEVA